MIHMSETIGGDRVRGNYEIKKSRYNRAGGYTEYQLLVPLTQELHNQGAWYRERELRIDRRS